MKEIRLYRIKGKTKSEKEVSTNCFYSYGAAVKNFLNKYPRFTGYAEVLAINAIQDNEIGTFSDKDSYSIDSFESSKEMRICF